MTLSRSVLFSLLSVFLVSCAIQVAPGGGEMDVTPPSVVSCEPPNFSTGFTGNEIRIHFDEYVALNDVSNQMVVSPLLKSSPEVMVKKKSIIVRLPDSLLENTTYTVNFGQAIMDNNEGNKLSDFLYVFSTGGVIDSSTVTGTITDAFTRSREKGVLAMLYRSGDDSMFMKERPLYFARTNDSGEFVINNVAPGSYTIAGLRESDANYLYTPGEEWVAFSEMPARANGEPVSLNLFREPPALRLNKAYSEHPGKAVLCFSAPADTLRIRWISDMMKMKLFATDYSPRKDSLFVWYENIDSDSLSLKLDNLNPGDTVSIRLFKGATESRGKKMLALNISPADNQPSLHNISRPYFAKCNHPVSAADFGKFILLEDTAPVKADIRFTDSLRMHLRISYPWKGKTKYTLQIPADAVRDFYGMYNDSVRIEFFVRPETDFGTMKLHFTSPGPSCVIQLSGEDGTVFREEASVGDTLFEFNYLDPRIYRIKIIEDANGNQKWDTGKLLQKLQPERVEYYPEKITVRANWEVEVFVKPAFR